MQLFTLRREEDINRVSAWLFIRYPENVDLIIFDIDNTLYRHRAYQNIQVDLLIQRYAEFCSLSPEEAHVRIEAARRTEGRRMGCEMTSMGNAMLSLGISLAENAKWRSELYKPEEYLQPDISLQDSVRKLASGFVLMAVTNNSREVGRRTLVTLGVEQYFDEIIGLETCNASKPSVEMFNMALQRASTRSENALSIGDRYEVDIAPALKVGMGGLLVESMEDVYGLPEVLVQSAKS